MLVRLQGILSAGETSLAAVLPAERGRDLLKSVRTHLVEVACETTCVSMHHDVSTITGEEVFVFTMHAEPVVHIAKRK